MTRLEALYILQHPRTSKGEINPYGPPRSTRPISTLSHEDEVRAHFRGLGFPEHQAEELTQLQLRREEKRVAERAARIKAMRAERLKPRRFHEGNGNG